MSKVIANKTTIFSLLLAITAAQIGISFVNLTPMGNISIALLLGASETILVGLFFMGLQNEQRLIKITALFPFVLFCIMNTAVILDVLIFMRH